MGNLFVRTGILFLLAGMAFGLYMGMKEDFTFAPAHAHLNLIGGVLMIITGIIYNSKPGIAPRLAPFHYGIYVVAVPTMVAGIAGAQVRAPWFPPVVGIGSILTLLAMAVFIFLVFKGTGKNATAA